MIDYVTYPLYDLYNFSGSNDITLKILYYSVTINESPLIPVFMLVNQF